MNNAVSIIYWKCVALWTSFLALDVWRDHQFNIPLVRIFLDSTVLQLHFYSVMKLLFADGVSRVWNTNAKRFLLFLSCLVGWVLINATWCFFCCLLCFFRFHLKKYGMSFFSVSLRFSLGNGVFSVGSFVTTSFMLHLLLSCVCIGYLTILT